MTFAGVFFIIPCVDIYEKIDMRTQTFDVPPQEVTFAIKRAVRDIFSMLFSDLNQGQRNSVCKCDNVLQGEKDCNHLYITRTNIININTRDLDKAGDRGSQKECESW